MHLFCQKTQRFVKKKIVVRAVCELNRPRALTTSSSSSNFSLSATNGLVNMASFVPVGLPVPRKRVTKASDSSLRTSLMDSGSKITSASKSNNSVCAVCFNGVVDGKDEALFYEGKCQGWLHRRCAEVSSHHFQCLTGSESPFLCIICTQEQHAITVNSLNVV